jgi:orotate phosphoribosyltransferase
MSDTQRAVARALLEIGAVGFSLDQPRTFKSGIISPVYVDNRTIPFHPIHWRTVIDGFRAVIETENLQADIIAGIAVGGVPHSAALAYTHGIPHVFVRSEAKGHGLRNRVEGGDVTGKPVLLVEDLVTTGGSSLSGVEALRESGATVTDCLAIVSYGFSDAVASFSEANMRLTTLTTFDVILDEASGTGRFTAEERTIVEDWFSDPHGWAERHGHKHE